MWRAVRISVGALLLCGAAAGQEAALPKLTADQIVDRLEQSNQRRAQELAGYQSQRKYELVYHGFPKTYEAAMEVAAKYSAPATKDFVIEDESGSKTIQTRVLHKLLESEKQAADEENQRHTALTRENYSFEMAGERKSDHGGCYLLDVKPKRDNKFLYRGQICVNAVDFAVETIDAEPAKNPSFWIKKTEIHHRYEKIGDFWLPASNDTTSISRFGGKAHLTISYQAYELKAREGAQSAEARSYR